jgi:putative endonuclease
MLNGISFFVHSTGLGAGVELSRHVPILIGMDSNACIPIIRDPGYTLRDAMLNGISFFMFYVYILKSEATGRYYIGYSEDPDRRLFEHNSGKVKSTRNYRPWVKIYSETYANEVLAIRREREIKSMKSRKYIESLMGGIE